MKFLQILTVAAVASFILASCSGPQKQSVESSYKCPSCKETVSYRYDANKPWVRTGKEVTHNCPNCKRAWGSNLSMTSTCTECAKEHLACPICAKHE